MPLFHGLVTCGKHCNLDSQQLLSRDGSADIARVEEILLLELGNCPVVELLLEALKGEGEL